MVSWFFLTDVESSNITTIMEVFYKKKELKRKQSCEVDPFSILQK